MNEATDTAYHSPLNLPERSRREPTFTFGTPIAKVAKVKPIRKYTQDEISAQLDAALKACETKPQLWEYLLIWSVAGGLTIVLAYYIWLRWFA